MDFAYGSKRVLLLSDEDSLSTRGQHQKIGLKCFVYFTSQQNVISEIHLDIDFKQAYSSVVYCVYTQLCDCTYPR